MSRDVSSSWYGSGKGPHGMLNTASFPVRRQDGSSRARHINRDHGCQDVQRLTRSRFQDLRPRFSPDGKRIAFTSSRDGNLEVYVMNVNGSGLKRMTNHPERDDYPTWHPNGKQLAIVSERAGRHDLYLVPVDPQD